ncbi:hypothetical protein BJY00DRAFT_111091 [Aspergillus carlsbadensis]|nr:hypothetical protein BJY00DRAFT_111091 [Aspergillus carlsbadensis]
MCKECGASGARPKQRQRNQNHPPFSLRFAPQGVLLHIVIPLPIPPSCTLPLFRPWFLFFFPFPVFFYISQRGVNLVFSAFIPLPCRSVISLYFRSKLIGQISLSPRRKTRGSR